MKLKIQNTIATFLILFCMAGAAEAKNIIVTNSADSGTGSLREAIETSADGDTILFKAAFTIYLETELFLSNKAIVIDGLVDGKKVQLDGSYSDADNDTIDDDGIYTRIFKLIGVDKKYVTLSNLVIQNGCTPIVTETDSVYAYGSGLYIDDWNGGYTTIENCIIENNILIYRENILSKAKTAYIKGAGVFSTLGGDFSDCTIRNNKIIAYNNKTLVSAGAGGCFETKCHFTRCLIAGNQLLAYSIVDNSIFTQGGGLFMGYYGAVINSVILGNSINTIDIGSKIILVLCVAVVFHYIILQLITLILY
ncbi:MAG: hypothetical protein IPO21_10325 [Bacteroidales bacterium]|nr:hypothetical protein [Bacteroidales bacterium]